MKRHAKKIPLAVAILVLMTLFAGCSKHTDDTSTQPAGTINAVQFYKDFDLAPPEIKTLVNKIMMSNGDGAFSDALKYLGQLDANPALNAAQKKSVADLTEQIKQKLAAKAAAR